MNINFLQDEVRNDYYISKDMKKIWQVQLDLLERFQRICNDYNLAYYVACGTLLGAVRHCGYIPWDDDIDIYMPRKDYNLFLERTKEIEEPYYLQYSEKDTKWFFHNFSRLRNNNTTGWDIKDLDKDNHSGIFIDIMPLDNCFDNSIIHKLQYNIIRQLHRLLWSKVYGKDYEEFRDMNHNKWKFYTMIGRYIPLKFLIKLQDTMMQLCKNNNSQKIISFTQYSNPYDGITYDREDFKESLLYDFEYMKVSVPNGYKSILTVCMGKDYMTFPPVELRYPHHATIFDADTPYLEYRKKIRGTFENIEGKKIVIFGAGQMLAHYLENKGKLYKPNYVVDNDKGKWGSYLYDYPIHNPEILLGEDMNNTRIIICSIYYKQIGKQLKAMGIEDYYIYVQKKEWLAK